MNISDEYTAYCFDEACAYIIGKIKDNKKPIFKKKSDRKLKMHYSKPSDMYKDMGYDYNEFVKINE